jgi:DNA-binding transcriptional LysR family regulator
VINLRSVDLNLLTIFDAIYTEQNLSRAAEHIGMSQPAMSAALGRLRVEFKDELFVRTGRGVKPTPRAIELSHPVRDVLDRIIATLSQVRSFDPETSQRLFTIASTDYGGTSVIPKLLEYMQRTQCAVRVNVWPQYESGLKDLMHFGSVDFAIDSTPITDTDFHNEILAREPVWCLVRADHPVIGNTLTIEQYLEAEHIAVYPQGGRASQLDEYLIERGMRRNHSIRVPSFFNMPYIVKSTDAICSLPETTARHFAKVHALRALRIPSVDWVATYYLMWHSSMAQNPAHQWLRNILVALSAGENRSQAKSA